MRSGQRIGKYVLGEQIARGGMAEVWAARVEGPGGFVKSLALKFILESFTGDSELERLFLNEARVAAQLQHANLVGVFDFDKVTDAESGAVGRYYIAMERVDGHDLRRVLQVARHNGHRLSPQIALYVAGEVLKGLRYVHERTDESGRKPLELVHRDVSPHNVLIGMGGEVKLSDFGIAKAMTQSLGTQTGTIRGKLAYASPEQLRGETADHRADQFGLGVTLWEMLADRRLFNGADEMEIIGKVLRCEIPPLPTEAGIDAAVETAVRRMLAGQVRDRFPSTAEALSAVLAVPGYVPDAEALATLMRELFGSRTVVQPPTVPLNLSPPPLVGALAETSQLERSPTGSPLIRSPGATGGRPARAAGDDPAPGSGGGPALAAGDSAYVSSDSSAIPAWVARPEAAPRPRRFIWAATALAIVAVGGIALVARQAAGPVAPAAPAAPGTPAAPSAVNVPDEPRPQRSEPVRAAASAPTGAFGPAPVPVPVPASGGPTPEEKPTAPASADPAPDGKAQASSPEGKRRRHLARENQSTAAGDQGRVGRAAAATRPARGEKGAAANAAPVLE